MNNHAELVKRETGLQNELPVGYFELFDAWQGKPQNRPFEDWESLIICVSR
jgi:hypothetical protein